MVMVSGDFNITSLLSFIVLLLKLSIFFNFECEQQSLVKSAFPVTLPPVEKTDNFINHILVIVYISKQQLCSSLL